MSLNGLTWDSLYDTPSFLCPIGLPKVMAVTCQRGVIGVDPLLLTTACGCAYGCVTHNDSFSGTGCSLQPSYKPVTDRQNDTRKMVQLHGVNKTLTSDQGGIPLVVREVNHLLSTAILTRENSPV